MTIQLNGEPFTLADPPGAHTIATLLEHLSIDPRRVAVEHNLVVLKRHTFATVMVSEGDSIEIVNFVGGGSHV